MSDIRQSAFAYPSPASHLPRTDLSLREILDMYRDNDLLKQILTAKTEEDKRRAEEEKCKAEQFRLQCKQVELEMMREQKKPPTIFTGVPREALNTSYNTKTSPSDIHSPYLPIPPTIDPHYSATTPTSAGGRLSPPSSVSNTHENSNNSNVLPFGSHHHH
ncbi:1088_t:CDS:2, partial [Ambispora leptoticha]